MNRTKAVVALTPFAILMAFLLAPLPACGPFPGPVPTPTPPPPTTTTTTTLPPAPASGLKVQGNRIVQLDGTDPRILGTIIGCHIDGIPGWPLVCVESLDAIRDAGLDWTHVRTGVFTAEGEAPEFAFYNRALPGSTKYDLTKINQDFLNLLRSKAQAAKDRGIYLEVDLPVDRWVRQHGREGTGAMVIHRGKSRKGHTVMISSSTLDPWSAQNNVQGEEHGGLGIFQVVPDPVHVAAIKAVVFTLCDFDNVTFQTGNEAFKSDSDIWENSVLQLVKETCAKPHVIGINSGFGSFLGDFQVFHQSSALSTAAKPVEVNEFGDDISPEQVIQQAQVADAQATYFEYWRGSHSSEEWLDTIKTLGKIRAQQPIPPVGCLPPPEDGKWQIVCRSRTDVMPAAPLCSSKGYSDQKSQVLRDAETKAAAEAKDKNGNLLFSGACLLDNSDAGYIAGLSAVGAAARAAGECGGRKDDAVFLRRNDGTHEDWYWQEEHAIARGSGCFTDPNRAWKFIYTHPATEPTPPPPTTCSLMPAQITEWRWQLKAEAGQQADLTVYVCGPAALAELKSCGTSCCPLGDIEGNGACREKLLGDPIFESFESPPMMTFIPQGAPPQFTVKINTGAAMCGTPPVPCAHIKARGSKGPNAFKKWHVFAGVPACDVDAAGICASESIP